MFVLALVHIWAVSPRYQLHVNKGIRPLAVENKVRFDRRLDGRGACKVAHPAIVPAPATAGKTNPVHAGVSQFSNTD